MTYVRLTLSLKPEEREALKCLARSERRRTEAQAAWLIRQELERRGLLPQGPAQASREGTREHTG